MSAAINSFAAAHPDMVFASDGFADFTLNGMALFLTSYLPPYETAFLQDLAASNYLPQPPSSGSVTRTVIMNPQTVVRTGTGNVAVAASGNIDLTNGPQATGQIYQNGSSRGSVQAGGTSIYTAGHPVVATTAQLMDPSSLQPCQLRGFL
jgi:hypothetical protein